MHKNHVQLDGAPPRSIIVPGDPGRVPIIGSDWETYTEVSFNREFRLARGPFENVEIGACSTGIGAPSVEIALVELAAAGADTFLRVGTCGAVQPEIAVGSLVIQEGAVRHTGSSDAYCERAYPAIADRDVTFALIEACEQLGYPYTVGLTVSTDSFFAGQNNSIPAPLPQLAMGPVAETMRALGVATFEMEAASLFILGRLLGLRTGSICSVESNRATGERGQVPDAIRKASHAASRAIAILAGWDAKRTRSGKRYVSASLLTEPA
jgi:uridine phosphorylase